MASIVAGCFIPLAAVLTKASVHDATAAPALLEELPWDTRLVLGDTAYQTPTLHEACAGQGWALVAPGWTTAPADDPRTPVRAVFHALRHVASENLNELVKDLFGLHGTVPTTGFLATSRSVRGCIFVYQVALWYRAEHRLPLNVGMKAFLRAA